MNLLHLHMLAAEWNWMLPKGASNLSEDVDFAWKLILLVTGFFFCVVVGSMTYFVIRYRRKTPNDVTSNITHNTPLEVVWTAVPLVLVVAFFYVGFKGFLNYDTPKSDCVVIDVEASKWKFSFTYPNGAQATNELYLQEGQDVRLNLHSIDVLHALYLPEFRTQRNLIPGRQTTIWFRPTELTPTKIQTDPKTGKTSEVQGDGWNFFCTQYCGDGHSRMFGHVYVLKPAAYEEKMKELANPFKKKLPSGKSVFVPYVTLGKDLYKQIGCASCHSDTGAVGTGPTWQGLWKRDHEFSFTTLPGYTLKASDDDAKWEEYLKTSILEPDHDLVRFNGVNYHGMSSFASQLSGTPSNDEKRRAIIDYIKSIGNMGWKPDISPETNPEWYDADSSPLKDKDGIPVHPESELGEKLRKALTQPGN
jgi:cytochrome c oxidase subunit 2